MFRHSIVFLCAVLVLSNVEFIQAGRYGGGGGSRHSGSHSYPKPSGGFSGGGHGYPSSGGLSGNGGRGSGYPGGGGHGYPSSGGLSGNGGHGSGGHNYPSSGVLSGNNNGRGGSNPGNTGSHNYPSGGNSGGLSGTNNHGSAGRGNQGTTNVHHHYHYNYNPPQQIHYTPSHGPAMNYPVYRGTPPTYVYQYKDSGSKYGTLLAGLALFNLGALAGGAVGYGVGHSSSHSNHYTPQTNEVCLFGIKKDNGDFEETRIECQLISSFIYAEQQKQKNAQSPTNSSTVVTTVTNSTTVNMTNDTPVYMLAANGTLVPPGSILSDAGNVTNGAAATGGSVTSQVTSVTVTNTTVVNAVDVKGPSIQVTPGMQCYVMRKTPSSRMKHEVPCGLLQTYADKSLKRNSAARNVPAFTILAVVCAVFVNNF